MNAANERSLTISADQIIAAQHVAMWIAGDLHVHLVGGITRDSYPAHCCYLTDSATWSRSARDAQQFDTESGARARAEAVCEVRRELAAHGVELGDSDLRPVLVGDLSDLRNWIANTDPCGAISGLGDVPAEQRGAAVGQLAAAFREEDHPAWGSDWAPWLAEHAERITGEWLATCAA